MAKESQDRVQGIGRITRGKSGTEAVEELQSKYARLKGALQERQRRLWAASEALSQGRGGMAVVSRATGLDPKTIAAGIEELKGVGTETRRQRRPGGGRKRLLQRQPALMAALEQLVGPATRGDPMSPLRWTSKSTAKLAAELQRQGYRISPRSLAGLLEAMGYSLQSNRKRREGSSHPDRDPQFSHIARQLEAFQQRGQPVISVDTKKKELIGEFKNGGREWQPKGQPEAVAVYDFPDPKQGKAAPYGVYDLARNNGWVSVGITHDTAEFAVESIRRWWRQMGQSVYPQATRLLITADGGGSNGSRTRLWKVQLQKLADDIGLDLSVCHFPPGTSKWNKIEHRMFCHITENWRGRPLTSTEVIVELIANTRTTQGLAIQAALDDTHYPTGVQVSDQELAQVRLEKDPFHGEWNYTIATQKPKP